MGGPVGALAAGLFQIFVDEPADQIADAMAALLRSSYILDLAPTQRRIERNVDPNAIANSGMKLRLVTVALEDGALHYVTEASRLLRERATGANFDEPIVPSGAAHPLVLGAMASAGIPGIFQARRIDTPSTGMHHVDGACVRYCLPMQPSNSVRNSCSTSPRPQRAEPA